MQRQNYVDAGSLSFRASALGAIFSILVVLIFVTWVSVSQEFLERSSFEDGWVEIMTAWFFAISGLLFFFAAKRSTFLSGQSWSYYFFLVGLGALMILFAGEESSWGQWYFEFEPSDEIKAVNTQNELNIHNLWFMQYSDDWNNYRYISIFILGIGVFLPLAPLSAPISVVKRRFAFPVIPTAYLFIFLGSYLFGKYYYDVLAGDTAAEIRELLLSIGMIVFALHGALWPNDLFRVTEVDESQDVR
jgi:hypothetical protein